MSSLKHDFYWPGVYLGSELPQAPSLSAPLPQEEGCFCPVRPGGGRDGAETPLDDRGTFHSSWAKEELDTEPGDHLESLLLAAWRNNETAQHKWSLHWQNVASHYLL